MSDQDHSHSLWPNKEETELGTLSLENKAFLIDLSSPVRV